MKNEHGEQFEGFEADDAIVAVALNFVSSLTRNRTLAWHANG